MVDIKITCSTIKSIVLLDIPEIHHVKTSGCGSQIDDGPSVVPGVVCRETLPVISPSSAADCPSGRIVGITFGHSASISGLHD